MRGLAFNRHSVWAIYRFELAHPIFHRLGLVGVLAVNVLRYSQVAVVFSVDFVECTFFALGLQSAAPEVDPLIQGMALGLKVVPIRWVARDLVGEQSGVEAQYGGLELAGDAKTLELSVCESAAQIRQVVPRRGSGPSDKHNQCDKKRAK